MQHEKYSAVRAFMKENNITWAALAEGMGMSGHGVRAIFVRGSCRVEPYRKLRELGWPEDLLPAPKVPNLPGLHVDLGTSITYDCKSAAANKREIEAGV